MRAISALALFCSFYLNSRSAHAAPLSQEALFYRCYFSLTGLRPASNHAELLNVKSGQATAIEACLEILKRAQLNALTGLPSSQTDPEIKAILSNFHQFHRIWFQNKTLSNFPGSGAPLNDLHDPAESALYLTRLLLTPSAPYSEVVTGRYSVRAKRSAGQRSIWMEPPTPAVVPYPEATLDHGDLVGIKQIRSSDPQWLSTALGVVFSLFTSPAALGPVYQFSSPRSFGGGIMGLQSYFYINSGIPIAGNGDIDPVLDPVEMNGAVSNASMRMPRRWSKNVLQELMCRNGPFLRTEDVSSLVVNYMSTVPANKQLGFRSSTNCMSCHATMDPMAASVRNFHFMTSTLSTDFSDQGAGGNRGFHLFLRARPVDLPSENMEYALMQRDPDFSRRPPKGALRYRSYDGTKVWLDIDPVNPSDPIDGLRQLGLQMAQSNDLYVCAAARYLQFFTGINTVSLLVDPGDSRNPPLSTRDKYYRDIAVKLGLSLKSHQSLAELVNEILNLDLYQDETMRGNN